MDAKVIKGRYRDSAVVMASGDSLGHPMDIVFSESEGDTAPKASLKVTKRKASKAKKKAKKKAKNK